MRTLNAAPGFWRTLVGVLVCVVVLGTLLGTEPRVQRTYAAFQDGKTMFPTPRSGKPTLPTRSGVRPTTPDPTSPPEPTSPPDPTSPPALATVPAVVASDQYLYVGPPTISQAIYVSVFCNANGRDSVICAQAPAMFDAVAIGGGDPAFELAHAGNESSFGQGGVGMPPFFNLHGIHGHGNHGCFRGTPFVNSAPGDEDMQGYDNYPDAVADWICLIKEGGLYFPERNTPERVVEIYCSCGGPEGKAEYVAKMKAMIDDWRKQSEH